MSSRVVHVRAASRLHFGLISLGSARPRVFGGIGVMVEPPNVQLRIEPADHFSVAGVHADRVADFVATWQRHWQLPNPPNCQIVLDSAPRMHIGLGVGTQLALSVARGLNLFSGREELDPATLAQSVGRGSRSAVGTHGFFHGGLIYEIGKGDTETLGPLAERLELSSEWRFVLITLRDSQGLFGCGEQQAFGQLPEFAEAMSDSLRREAQQQLLPAANSADFAAFSESVFRFGYQSGMGFAAVQGGAYNGASLSSMVDALRSHGVRGVGQSSWGPTIFAICETESDAEELVDWSEKQTWAERCDLSIARPCNHGAVVWLNSA